MITPNEMSKILNDKSVDALLVTGERNIAYVTGFCGLEGLVFFHKNGLGFCYTDSRYIEAAEKSLSEYGFKVSMPEKGKSAFDSVKRICEELSVEKAGFEDEIMTYAEYKKIREKLPCELIGLSSVFTELRSVKTQEETDNIVKAQRIAEKALDQLLSEIKPGMTENMCKARLEYYMSCGGSEGPAFDTIFISGKKTSMPHGTPGEKIIEKGDFVTVDFGAKIKGYRSDMTRTFAIGEASEEMKKVYGIVLEAQLAGVDAAMAGKKGKEIDKAARDVIDKAGYGKYFGHSLGHSVGLDIHERPSASPYSDETIKEGTILTIEPGIYIPDHFGVRIEDMVFIKQGGNNNLTKFEKNLIII